MIKQIIIQEIQENEESLCNQGDVDLLQYEGVLSLSIGP